MMFVELLLLCLIPRTTGKSFLFSFLYVTMGYGYGLMTPVAFLWPLQAQKQGYHITFTSAKTQTPPRAPLDCKGSFARQDQEFFLFPPHPGVPSSLAAIFILLQPTSHLNFGHFQVNSSFLPTTHLKQLITVIYEKKTDQAQAVPHLPASGVLGPWLRYVVLEIDTESLFEILAGNAAICITLTEEWSSFSCFNKAHDFRSIYTWAVREEGDTHWFQLDCFNNPGDQWKMMLQVRRLHTQFALNEHSDKQYFPCHNLFL